MRRRLLGHAAFVSRCVLPRPWVRWRTSAWTCGWNSMPIPRWHMRSRNALWRAEPKRTVISSARREREFESVLEAAMDLHRAGVPLDFSAMTPSRHLLSLPAYAWEKTRWWNEASDARDGRLAPGGRGLFDVRLPRAMPTWIVRLDSRHMAFLKDHKVENHVIFPAAAFVEMALEAGVQLFEGQPFVVEDFEIRKPLILPDPPSGVQLEFSYSPNERTFSIQSRFEQSVTWSLHVVGSLRGERTESVFASSKWAAAVRHSIRRGRRLLPPHERSGLALWGGISTYSRIVGRCRAIRGARGLVGCAVSPRGRICSASRSLRRSASSFLRRRGNG